MGGPSTSRLPNNMTAPQPSLTNPGLELLQGIFGGGGQTGGGPSIPGNTGNGLMDRALGNARSSAGASSTAGTGAPLAPGSDLYSRMQSTFGQSALQRQLGNTYSQLLGPQGNPLGQGGPGFQSAMQNLTQIAGQGSPQNLLNAYQPIFQRNLAQIQGSGPRFSSGNALASTQALNDYNLFAQQTLQNAQSQRIQAALGAGNLGLGAGAQQNQLLGEAGGFATAQAGQQQALMQQLLGALFQGGGIGTPAVLNQQPGFGQQLLGALGSIGGLALGGGLGGLFGGGGPPGLSSMFPGGMPTVDPSQLPAAYSGGMPYSL